MKVYRFLYGGDGDALLHAVRKRCAYRSPIFMNISRHQNLELAALGQRQGKSTHYTDH
jgi:hypothetical protein